MNTSKFSALLIYGVSVLFSIFGVMACSDDVSGNDEQEPDVGFVRADSGVVIQDAGVMVDAGYVEARWELEIQGSRGAFLFYKNSMELTVKLTQGGRPLQNRRVSFTMLKDGIDQQSVNGTQLRALNATTNPDGIASVQLVAGQMDATFRVEASSGEADPVYWEITVGREGAGGLSVRVHYCPKDTDAADCPAGTTPGRYSFANHMKQAEVVLYQGTTCENLTAALSQGTIVPGFETAAIRPFDEFRNAVGFEDLDDGTQFVVFAKGQVIGSSSDAYIAYGCNEATVIGGENQIIDIALKDKPLELKGKFTVVNQFDLVDLLRNTGNDTFDKIADILEIFGLLGSDSSSRNEQIADIVCQNFGQEYQDLCGILVGTVGVGMLDAVLATLAERFPAIDTVMTVLQAVSDVLDIVGDLTTIGEIEFVNNPDEEGVIPGTSSTEWKKFRFKWRNGCPDAGAGGSACSHEITIGALVNNNTPTNARQVYGDFVSTVDGMDLVIEPYTYNFSYGLLILGVMEQWVFPRIMYGQSNWRGHVVTLSEFLNFVIPCENLSDSYVSICEDVLVAALAEVLEELIGKLNANPQAFKMHGRVELVDVDNNLTIDQLKNGVWTGILSVNNVQLDFEGCFTGCRGTAECPELTCVPPHNVVR